MLEEKNDSLQNADGNQENEGQNGSQNENSQADSVSENTVETPVLAETEVAPEEANAVEISPEELEETVAVSENQPALDAISESNAEESEDETLKDRHDIPKLDYDTLDMEALVSELENDRKRCEPRT